jgi:DNA-binding IclR family transcriptional regulator
VAISNAGDCRFHFSSEGESVSERVVAGLKAVQIVAGRPDPTTPIAVGAIAERLGVGLSSASRLCSELEGAGFLERAEGYGTYRLGPAAIRLSGRASAPYARSVRYALTLAAQQTGETVCLAARADSDIRIIASVESLWTLHSPAEVGELVADEGSAIARAMSGRDSDAADAAAPQHFESTTGLSVEVAAPVLSPGGERVAVVAVRLPENRSDQNLARARRAVAVARRTIERAIEEDAAAHREAAAPRRASGTQQSAQEPARQPTGPLPSAPPPSALEAALRILDHLAGGRDSIAGTARATGLRADRTQRIVDSCQRAGLVWANRDRSQFQLGWIVGGWHRAAVAPILVARGKPLVAEVANSTRTCAFITVLKGMRSFTLVEELEMAGEGLQMSPWIGRPHPLIGSDGGPTLVMDFSADEVAQLFPSRHTVQERDVFLDRVHRVERDGVLSMQAFEDAGIVSISAPVRDSSGAVAAAACIVGTTGYMTENADEFERAALNLADRISALLA